MYRGEIKPNSSITKECFMEEIKMVATFENLAAIHGMEVWKHLHSMTEKFGLDPEKVETVKKALAGDKVYEEELVKLLG